MTSSHRQNEKRGKTGEKKDLDRLYCCELEKSLPAAHGRDRPKEA